MKVERAVVDTNVLIGAAITRGEAARLVDRLVAKTTLLMSAACFEELATRLMRPKFDRYVSREEREEFLVELTRIAEWVEITGGLKVCRDADDDKILETAILGAAGCIVTRDADLLVLHPFRGIMILTPGQVIKRLAEQG